MEKTGINESFFSIKSPNKRAPPAVNVTITILPISIKRISIGLLLLSGFFKY